MQDRPQRGPVRLVIVLERVDPIEGELLEPSALAARFRGWLALASLIESARIDTENPSLSQAPSGQRPHAEHQGGSPM
jgi:hypothetical protein